MPLFSRLQHIGLALQVLPGWLRDARQRAWLTEARAFCAALPQALNGPLPAALQRLTPEQADLAGRADAATLRRLADLAALLERRSPLGLCLRRSLIRYYFLRRAGLSVTLAFGARFADERPDRPVTGHAWLTLGGQPYCEAAENWRGFTIMFNFPTS